MAAEESDHKPKVPQKDATGQNELGEILPGSHVSAPESIRDFAAGADFAPGSNSASPSTSAATPDAGESVEPYIVFRDVSISFGDRKVLDGVSFWLERGHTLCILGRSGVGKSVSLRMLLGFLKPDSGSIRINGTEVTTLDEAGMEKVRKQVTMVFQNGALFDSLSVSENIAFPLREEGGLTEDQIQAIAGRLLVLVGAGDTADELPSSLSTGQKRSIAIARALAAEPESILYDEPTTMVDPIMGRRLGDLIQKLKYQLGLTSIVVTHDMRFAAKLADRVLFLDQGKASYFGDLEGFQASPDPSIQQFLSLDAYSLPVC